MSINGARYRVTELLPPWSSTNHPANREKGTSGFRSKAGLACHSAFCLKIGCRGDSMDIKKIEELTKSLQNDGNLVKKFEKNPAAVIESVLGVDLPDDKVNEVVKMVQGKGLLDNAGGILSGLLGKK